MSDILERSARHLIDNPPSEGLSANGIRQRVATRRRRRSAVATTAMLFVGVGGLIMLQQPDDAGTSNSGLPPSAATLAEQNPATLPAVDLVIETPTLAADPAQMWWIPNRLPVGYRYDIAENGIDVQNLIYAEGGGSGQIIIQMNPISQDNSIRGTSSTDIAGNEWILEDSSDPDWISMSRLVDDTQLRVSGKGLTETQVIDVATVLTHEPATQLPRPPFNTASSGGIQVAELNLNGVSKQLKVNTDGVKFAMGIDGIGGVAAALGDEALVWVGGSSSSASGNAASMTLMWGLVRSDVATIDIELTDGRIITVQAQDESDQFAANFFLAAVPTSAAEGVSAIVSKSASGAELSRQNDVYL
jgi:hypothetical protein